MDKESIKKQLQQTVTELHALGVEYEGYQTRLKEVLDELSEQGRIKSWVLCEPMKHLVYDFVVVTHDEEVTLVNLVEKVKETEYASYLDLMVINYEGDVVIPSGNVDPEYENRLEHYNKLKQQKDNIEKLQEEKIAIYDKIDEDSVLVKRLAELHVLKLKQETVLGYLETGFIK